MFVWNIEAWDAINQLLLYYTYVVQYVNVRHRDSQINFETHKYVAVEID